jgi:intein/homing endonuclease
MLMHELFTRAGVGMDTFMAEALGNQLDSIERIDRLTAIAESRRNASLREIDRRRAVLREALRRSVQEVEEAEFEVIEAIPAKGKDAA